MSALSLVESPLYLGSGPEAVFALHTPASGPNAGLGVVLAHSGANNFSSHRNGVFTSMARRLQREGIPSLRFDFAGTGESSGQFRPLARQPTTDVLAAMDALNAAGCERLLVVASCYGAIPSVIAASEHGDVEAMILLSPPLVFPEGGRIATLRQRIREVVNLSTLRLVLTNGEFRRWFFARLASLIRTRVAVRARRLGSTDSAGTASEPHPDHRAGRRMPVDSELAHLVKTGSRVEVIYGAIDGNLALVEEDPQAAFSLGLLRERPSGLEWTVLDGPVHGLEDVVIQEQLIERVVERARAMTDGHVAANTRP